MRMIASPLMSASSEYIEWLYQEYCRDPQSVDPQWAVAFAMVGEVGHVPGALASRSIATPLALGAILKRDGHQLANINPLDASRRDVSQTLAALVTMAAEDERAPMDPGGSDLRRARSYLHTLAVETGHLDDIRARRWIAQQFAKVGDVHQPEERKMVAQALLRASEFERFLSVKFPTKKRFGCEGAEAVVPLLASIIRRASENGVQRVVIGTMHRGRLNLMANVLGEPLVDLLAKLKGAHPYDSADAIPADVPYHLGLETSATFGDRTVEISLLPNPSHLEAVNSVVLGRTRALQDLAVAEGRAPSSVLPIILHTDASVIGQGSVAEMIQLAAPAGFTTRGTIHIVINNQIGFTTDIQDARSSRYCTGAWKAVDSAILHLNGDDPDALINAAEIAVGYRHEFGRDAVIDLVCYRKNGHNEIDEPRFTQPLLYQKIDGHEPVSKLYERALIADGVVGEEFLRDIAASYWNELQAAYEGAPSWRPNSSGYPDGRWTPFVTDASAPPEPVTGVDLKMLVQMSEALAYLPEGFTADPKISRQVQQRANLEKGIAWALGEALAFGSLLWEGTGIRHSGQDIERGAFSHRHFAIVDQASGDRFVNLRQAGKPSARFDVVNSPLSEYGVLAFEYGYSLVRPDMLTIWEAQFGDFANGAQIVIDQFLTSGEDKWRQPSGLTVLLPHGLEGQGPEHSSARVERYLQMAARDNIQLANPTTPANYFHLLRRQVLRPQRKPLFVFSPKVLLRLPAALSEAKEFGPKTRFAPVIATGGVRPVRRVLLCSGKFYYELEAARQAENREDILIVRLEMLYPLPADQLAAVFSKHRAAQYVWIQEEPINMGAWSYLDRPLQKLLGSFGVDEIRCVSRPAASSPAGSFHGVHEQDQKRIVEEAFNF